MGFDEGSASSFTYQISCPETKFDVWARTRVVWSPQRDCGLVGHISGSHSRKEDQETVSAAD